MSLQVHLGPPVPSSVREPFVLRGAIAPPPAAGSLGDILESERRGLGAMTTARGWGGELVERAPSQPSHAELVGSQRSEWSVSSLLSQMAHRQPRDEAAHIDTEVRRLATAHSAFRVAPPARLQPVV